MSSPYRKTLHACFTGSVVQAITTLFITLLYVYFQEHYLILLEKITLVITVYFVLQLIVDFVAALWVDRIGYRAAAITAHACAFSGLVMLPVTLELLSDPFVGLLIPVSLCAIGSGLLEVITSPMVEACPSDHKAQTMSLLHSFYCWGSVAVAGLTTLFFALFGIENWAFMALIWALIPLLNGIRFCRVPIAPLIPRGEKRLSFKELFHNRLFRILLLLMICAGASELCVSQWASAYAETGLGVSKAVADLLGPALFAAMMGIARTGYSRFGAKLPLDKMMRASSCLCLAAYGLIVLSPSPLVGLAGIGLSGLGVGILWPGTCSLAAATIRGGGTAMFALMALAGDLGCSLGPTLTGLVASQYGDQLRIGLLAALIFPAAMAALLPLMKLRQPNHSEN